MSEEVVVICEECVCERCGLPLEDEDDDINGLCWMCYYIDRECK